MYNSKLQSEATDHLFDAILTLRSREDCYRFFEDLCTITEIMDFSQRFHIAGMLANEVTYAAITEATGVSSTTVARINRCLKFGDAGGYRLAMERLNEKNPETDK